MELIVINVGYELRVVPPSVFCMLVLMALITTVMTTPILIRMMRGTELEGYIDRSGFLRPAAEVALPIPIPGGNVSAVDLLAGAAGASAVSTAPVRGGAGGDVATVPSLAGAAGTSAEPVPFNAVWDD
jgi:hypothetical protein